MRMECSSFNEKCQIIHLVVTLSRKSHFAKVFPSMFNVLHSSVTVDDD